MLERLKNFVEILKNLRIRIPNKYLFWIKFPELREFGVKLDTYSRYKSGKYKFFEKDDKEDSDKAIIYNEFKAKIDEGKTPNEAHLQALAQIQSLKKLDYDNPVFETMNKKEWENYLKEEELNFYNSKIYCPVCFREGIKSNKHIKKRFQDWDGWEGLAGRAGELYYCEKHTFDIKIGKMWMS